MSDNLKKCPKCETIMHTSFSRCVKCDFFFDSNSTIKTAIDTDYGKSLETGEENFLTINGRIRRSTFFIRSIILAIPNLSFVFPLDSGLQQNPALIILFLLIIVLFGILNLIQGVKRLHDMNLEGFFVFLLLVPVVNIFFYIFMLIKDSHPGKNKFGEDPKKSVRLENREVIKPSLSKNKPNRKIGKNLSQDYKITDLEYLEKLANLKDRGVISEEEFKSKKQKILGA